MEVLTARHYSFGDFELDTARRVLFKNGEPVKLKSKAFDLLLALIDHRGEVLSKDELLEIVWAGQFVEEGNLTVHISALRKALGDSTQGSSFIVTVPGRGYSFVGHLKNDSELVVESHRVARIVVEQGVAENGMPAELGRSIRSPRSSRRFTLLIAGISVAVFLSGAVFFQKWRASATSVPFQQMSMRRLTTIGTVGISAISPDGKLFAYSEHNGDAESLWLGHVDGGDPMQLRPPAEVVYLGIRFGHDGSSVYYTASNSNSPGTLYKIPIVGGPPEKIRDGFRTLSFSPDGHLYAFVRVDQTSGGSVLAVSNLEGGGDHDLAESTGETGSDWSNPAWSPDGRTIAVIGETADGGSTIFGADASDGTVRRLTPKSWNTVRSIAWLPRGQGLVAVAVDKKAIPFQLWHIAADGESRRLTNDLSFYTFVTSDASGSLLAAEGRNQSNIWLGPSDDPAVSKQVTFGSAGEDNGWWGMTWSPDGRIIYTVDTDSGTNIWAMDADGKNKTQLTPAGGINNYPSLTADGKYLVFQSNRGGHWAVWRLRLTDNDLRQLTGDEIAGEPFVSPDGKWIVYENTSDNTGELLRMSIDGANATKLSDHVAEWPQISPDGEYISVGLEIDNVEKLAVLSIDGGEPLVTFDLPRLTNLRFGAQWTGDGQALTYRDWANGVWRQSIRGGPPQHIDGLPQEKLAEFAWSHDGKQLAFSRAIGPRDVVLIDDQSK